MTLVHWDDVEPYGVPDRLQPLGGRKQRLADAAGSVRVGAHRVTLAPGQMITPPHLHTAEEEIFHVIAGSATLWQDGKTCVVAVSDTIVHNAGGAAHTLIAGDDGLEVLIFGTRLTPELAFLPRTQVMWFPKASVTAGEAHPWTAEAALGIPDGEPAERPANVVALADVEGDYGGMWKRVAAAGGAKRSGLNWAHLPPHEEGAEPHCHTADEEVFVVIDGEGIFELWGRPDPAKTPATEPAESHLVRRGHVISRPASTGIAHCLRAGEKAMTYLAYGTREANDVCYYPRSNTLFFRGLGLATQVEPLDTSR